MVPEAGYDALSDTFATLRGVSSTEDEPRGTSTPAGRLDRLRGEDEPARGMTARTLAALAANPGCRRRSLLDAAGVDKAAIAEHIGAPAPYGQSQFAIARGHGFERRVFANGCGELLSLAGTHLGLDVPAERVWLPEVAPEGAERPERLDRTREALREATAGRGWAVLVHPMLRLEVAGSMAHLEPDAVVVRPDGGWIVVEVKSFAVVDGSAEPSKVGAAARQAAVYALALRGHAAELAAENEDGENGEAVSSALLVCPKDFSNLPTAAVLDLTSQLAVTRRQLTRMARVDTIVDDLPTEVSFDLRHRGEGQRRAPTRAPEQLRAAVDTVPASYAPECLSSCELAFHCRSAARESGTLELLGRSVRGELGGLYTVDAVCEAATGGVRHAGEGGQEEAPTSSAAHAEAARWLHRASQLRTEALREASWV